jgi:hypothetical protein
MDEKIFSTNLLSQVHPASAHLIEVLFLSTLATKVQADTFTTLMKRAQKLCSNPSKICRLTTIKQIQLIILISF